MVTGAAVGGKIRRGVGSLGGLESPAVVRNLRYRLASSIREPFVDWKELQTSMPSEKSISVAVNCIVGRRLYAESHLREVVNAEVSCY